MKELKLYLFASLLSSIAVGQNVFFSQYESASVYFNPAYSSHEIQYGGGLLARNQWANSKAAFLFTHVHGDYRINPNHGLSIAFTHQNANSGSFNKSNLNLSYAYTASLSPRWQIAAGTGLGIRSFIISPENLIFEDAILSGGNTAEQLENIANTTSFGLDLGVHLFSKDETSIAIGLQNINFPSFDGIVQKMDINPAITLFSSYRKQISGNYYRPSALKAYLIPSFVLLYQMPFTQMRIGANAELESVLLGLHYRGLFGTIEDEFQSDAIILQAGLKKEYLKFVYSYDLSVSGRTSAGGTHELSVQYSVPKRSSYKRQKRRR